MGEIPPSRSSLASAGPLIAATLAASESFWVFVSGHLPPIEFAWIIGGAFLIAALTVGIAVAARELRTPARVVRAILGLVPITLFTVRGAYRSSLSLDAALGPGLRGGVFLLLSGACIVLVTRTDGLSNAFRRGLAVLMQAAVAAFAFRTMDVPRLRMSILSEPGQVAAATAAVVALLLPVVTWEGEPRRQPRLVAWWLTLGLVFPFVLGLTAPYLPPPPPGPSGTPVILIVLDTVRADAVDLYSDKVRTPGLRRFANAATLYTNAYSNGTDSMAGHGALFTGLLPSDHKGHPRKASKGLNLYQPLDPGADSIATRLGKQGYVTAAISANFGFFSPHFGLGRGFSSMRADGLMANFVAFGWPLRSWLFGAGGLPVARPWEAAQIRLASERWLGKADGAFFLFLNFMDAHTIHEDPGGRTVTYRRHEGLDNGVPAMSEQRRDYQSSVAYLDSNIDGLMTFMKGQAWWDKALVIVTADHGELFGEHDEFSHGNCFPFEGVLRVPLIVKYPGQRSPATERALVSLRDVPAIVAGAVNGKLWRPSEELRPLIVAESWWTGGNAVSLPPEGVPFSRAIRLGPHKLIEQWDGRHMLFDLGHDQDETNNLFETDRALAEGVKAVMLRGLPPMDSKAGPSQGATIPAETLERLRSLGYVR